MCHYLHFTVNLLHSCSLSRGSDRPQSASGCNHVKKLDPGKKEISTFVLKTDSVIKHLCAVFFHCVVILLSCKAPLRGKGFVTLSADMRGYWLVSDEGRNGQRGGEWWESPEAFTLGDHDQHQNKNRPFSTPHPPFPRKPWEREPRVHPSQPYYKTTEEEEVQRQRSFMEDSRGSVFFFLLDIILNI